MLLLREHPLPKILRTKQRFDARTDPDKARREVVTWAKRQRDMRRDAKRQAPGVFLELEPVDFVGRAEHLEKLYASVAEKTGTFLLHGEPGTGKSTLALKFAWRAQGAFEAVAFQLCGQRPVAEIVAELEVKTLPPDQQITNVKEWLAQQRSLLVLDDVSNADVQALIPGPPVSVLCTSRQRIWRWVGTNWIKEVKSFSRDESESIFRLFLGEETLAAHRDALMRFAERVEWLPIAVVVGADLLRRWKDCRECLAEIIPASEFLWSKGEPDRAARLVVWGFLTGRRIGELEMALRILKREEIFLVGVRRSQSARAPPEKLRQSGLDPPRLGETRGRHGPPQKAGSPLPGVGTEELTRITRVPLASNQIRHAGLQNAGRMTHDASYTSLSTGFRQSLAQ